MSRKLAGEPGRGEVNSRTLMANYKSTIIALLAIAAWITTLYIKFIGTPPPDNINGNPQDLTFTARIIIFVFFVLWVSLAVSLSWRNHLRFWTASLLISFSLALVTISGYFIAKKLLVCEMDDGRSFITGRGLFDDNYTQLGNNYIAANKNATCQALIDFSTSVPKLAWNERAILRNEVVLKGLFLLGAPFFVFMLSSAVMILICSNRPDFRSHYSGNWIEKDSTKETSDVLLELAYINKNIGGKVGFIRINDVRRRWEYLTEKNSKFDFFTRLKFELEQPPEKYKMAASSNENLAILTRIKGERKSWILTKTLSSPVTDDADKDSVDLLTAEELIPDNLRGNV
ncbi:MAG TPA: hypothetical protein VJ842_18710 [Pyrinomonadaceae bacterium]|nr:hypothetical protein [Pyrinomonadaceae bacterium]